MDPVFPWEDQGWPGIPLKEYLLYEIHVGTFTPEGTFEAVIPHLRELQDLGITALELMPVAQFPGNRNWGYDGVHPFAVQNSYGGPEGLKRLVNACHRHGLAVVLDVVYNHLGPEGNYLREFGPYFTDQYRTPWGEAVNLDGPHSDEVRRFFMENALSWITDFHIDGLRLDALHAVFDLSAQPFLRELAEGVHGRGERLRRKVSLFAESDRNEVRLIQEPEAGGYGIDAHWNDDFHHSLHTVLTGEAGGYYEDFGALAQLQKALTEGFVYSGQYSSFRKRRHGSNSAQLPARKFVVFSQNHDQVGNRPFGERLSRLVSFEALKLAASAVLLSPFIPLLFMGEEYGETAPFLYFVSHSDPDLIEAVRQGRKKEFSSPSCPTYPADPQEVETFLRSTLNHRLRGQAPHDRLREFYRELIRLRRSLRPLAVLSKKQMEGFGLERERVLFLRRWEGREEALLIFHFSDSHRTVSLPLLSGVWRKELDSKDERWGGEGSQVPGSLDFEGGESDLPLQPLAFLCYSGLREA
jgi:maltooligosyltrehalose trehalohydrolase